MHSSEDFVQVKRLDNAATIEFFGCAATAIVNAKFLDESQAEKWRVSLSSLQFGDAATTSLFCQLVEQDDEFTRSLMIRYGTVNLWRNLLRYTMSHYFGQIRQLLSTAGQVCIEKSQISLNKHFVIHLAGKSENRVLMAGVLIDCAEILADICGQLQTQTQRLNKLLASDLVSRTERDKRIDDDFRQGLGFSGYETVQLPYSAETSVKNQFIASMDYFCQTSREILDQFQQNRGGEDTSKLLVHCDSLQARVLAFSSFQFPKTHDINALETRRMEMLVQLNALTTYLGDYLTHFTAYIGRIPPLDTPLPKVAGNIMRTIAHAMQQKSVLATPALSAAQDLVTYCDKHQVSPEKVLPAELVKINPHLNVEALSVFSALTSNAHIAGSASSDKQHHMERSAALTKTFAGMLIALLLCLPLLPGCGVKTLPESELVDFRPPIEYHTRPRPTATAEPKEDNSKPKKKLETEKPTK